MKITRPPKSVIGIAGFVALAAACQEPPSEADATEARDGDLALGGTVGRFETRAMTMLDGTARIVHYLIEGNDEHEIVLPDGMEIPRDAVVRAYGEPNDEGALAVESFDIIQLAPEKLIDPEPYGPRRIATILLTWEGAGGIGNGVAEQDMYTGERSTNVFYAENSYGRETMAGRVFGPYTIDEPPSCNSTAIANAGLQVFAERGHREDDWRQIMFYFPGLDGCGWSGLASVGSVEAPAKNSWYNGSFGCVVRNQELGHNYGMGHSHAYQNCPEGVVFDADACEHEEYGDPYDPMGGGCRHINAVQKGFMGWLEGCNYVDGSQSGVYNVSPLELPCNGTQALRVPTTDGRWYYLEYRQPIGQFDGSLSGGVIAHVAGDINNFGPSPYILDLGLGGLMQEGDSFSDPGGGVTFTVAEDNGTHAVIQVDYPEGAEQSAPTCIDGTEPEMAGGAVGSLDCAEEPYPGDSEPPTVTITAPADGDVFAPGSDFLITAEPADDRGIIELELYINGEPQFKLYEPPWEWDVTNIPEGVYEFGVVARDSRFWAPSQAVTVDVGMVPDPDDSAGDSSGGVTDSGTSGPATTGEPEDDDTDSGSGSGGDGSAADGGGCRTGGSGAPLSALLLLSFGWIRRRS
ncbi:MAG: Ig-like domain-containing protein [Nannocystales bacterium]